jgi:hypothetical protein
VERIWKEVVVTKLQVIFRYLPRGTEHYVVVANVTERLTMSKQTTQRVHMERFNLKKLNEVEGKVVLNTIAALEN